MNYEEFQEAQSQPQSTGREVNELIAVLDRILPTIEQGLGQQIGNQIRQKLKQQCSSNDKLIAELMELIIATLIAQIQILKGKLAMDIRKSDYEVLQTSIQKAEAEIRNHIKIEQQLKLYMDSLEQKIQQLEIKLKLTERKNKSYQEKVQQCEIEHGALLKKIQKYEEKIYEINRESKWESCDKKSYEQLMQKASLNLRERIKPDPYLSNFSKSKQLMARIKEKPKNYKGSIAINFDTLHNGRTQNSESHLHARKQKRNSEHHHLSTEQSFKQLNTSLQMNELEKKRKKRFSKYITEGGQKKQNGTSSLYL